MVLWSLVSPLIFRPKAEVGRQRAIAPRGPMIRWTEIGRVEEQEEKVSA